MEVTRPYGRRGVAAAGLGAVLLAILLALVPTASHAGPGVAATASHSGSGVAAAGTLCAHANDEPAEATLRQLKRALFCLINKRRQAGDKPRLERNRKLNRVAGRHTEKMLEEDCFLQTCPGERSFPERVRRSGYPDGAERWKAAENLGCGPTPRKMFRAFMDTRFTRRNILNERFRDVGIGARKGSPASVDQCQPSADFVTYTVVFAWRRG